MKLEDILKGDMGANITIGKGKNPIRIPSGIFSVDFATCGGVAPLWQSACLWSGESGGKSSLAGDITREAQQLCWRCFNYLPVCECSSSPLKLKAVLVDVEGTHDAEWWGKIGVDVDELVVVNASSGEEFIDVSEALLQADEVGLLVFDSLAALVPEYEMDNSIASQSYAIQPRLIGRAVRKLKQRLIREKLNGHPCSILFLNQMRNKINGLPNQNPETQSGGYGMKHEFSLLLRLAQRTLTASDKNKFSSETTDLPMVVRHSFTVKKNKILILAGSGEYLRAREYIKQYSLPPGQVDDFSTLISYARKYDLLVKDKKYWRFNLDIESLDKFAQLAAIDDFLRNNRLIKMFIQQAIIQRAKEMVFGCQK